MPSSHTPDRRWQIRYSAKESASKGDHTFNGPFSTDEVIERLRKDISINTIVDLESEEAYSALEWGRIFANAPRQKPATPPHRQTVLNRDLKSNHPQAQIVKVAGTGTQSVRDRDRQQTESRKAFEADARVAWGNLMSLFILCLLVGGCVVSLNSCGRYDPNWRRNPKWEQYEEVPLPSYPGVPSG